MVILTISSLVIHFHMQLKMLEEPVLTQPKLVVVYFDQRLGAAHSKRWSKYTTTSVKYHSNFGYQW